MSVVVDAGTLGNRLRTALRHEWDPIGIGMMAEARDEYDGYVDDLAGRVLRQATISEIFDYLWAVETQHMGLTGDAASTQLFAEALSSLPTATK